MKRVLPNKLKQAVLEDSPYSVAIINNPKPIESVPDQVLMAISSQLVINYRVIKFPIVISVKVNQIKVPVEFGLETISGVV
ncbi:hypothetical protein GCM10007053_18570 [Halioglobus pacificus]|uniref:Uncharacterized protein n=1 Tax=Parahalioglobus pacificus TaxID=930806 RepID=A0A919CLK6_9GAMM|nr:hypothetical protein GCM10007053_18570 [Halioglobus pacificus]